MCRLIALIVSVIMYILTQHFFFFSISSVIVVVAVYICLLLSVLSCMFAACDVRMNSDVLVQYIVSLH